MNEKFLNFLIQEIHREYTDFVEMCKTQNVQYFMNNCYKVHFYNSVYEKLSFRKFWDSHNNILIKIEEYYGKSERINIIETLYKNRLYEFNKDFFNIKKSLNIVFVNKD